MEARLTRISQSEALRYLGVHGSPDSSLQADLDRCMGLLVSTVRPRVCWRLFPVAETGIWQGTSFCPEGTDIRKHMAGCNQAVGIAATLGSETETLLCRAQARDMADAVILDALASAAIENVCDNLCSDLALFLAPRKLTPRFSPGYGDFPLSQQRELCTVLNVDRLLGITLTPGGLMIPQKSVTAVLGVSGKEQDQKSGCENCILSDCCMYKKEGSPCGKQ